MYFIGIDVGTSGTKAVLIDETGAVHRTHTEEYPMHQPKNGWAEQNPSDWWEATKLSLSAVCEGIDKICGIGLTGQMHGLVMLNENNAVIRPAIIWCDQRTGKECAEMTETVGADKLFSITAAPAMSGFTAAKILWVKNNEPENFKKCRHILLPKDYIRFMLTGKFATDVSDAGGMQLMDIKNRTWSDEVLDALEIDKSLLPKIYESPEVSGFVKSTDVPACLCGVPVAAGAGDNAAAAVGTSIVENGKAFTTIGTSGVVFAHTDEPLIDPKGRIHTFCCAVPGKWHVMGVTQAAGLSLKWFRDNFCELETMNAEKQNTDVYALLDEKAKTSPIGANHLVYLPYLMGERTPHLDPDARGVFFGLSAMHTKADLLRAILEGVSFSLYDCVNLLKETGAEVSDMTICGGGGKSPFWSQILSNVYGTEIKTVSCSEGPAYGAAILASVSAGAFDTVESACKALIRSGKTFVPDEAEHGAYQTVYGLYQSLYPSLKNLYQQLK